MPDMRNFALLRFPRYTTWMEVGHWVDKDMESLVQERGTTCAGGQTLLAGAEILEIVRAEDFETLDWTLTSLWLDRGQHDTGWVAPDGTWLGCDNRHHDFFVYWIFQKTLEQVEQEGWVRVVVNTCPQRGDGSDRLTWTCRKKLTTTQRATLVKRGFDPDTQPWDDCGREDPILVEDPLMPLTDSEPAPESTLPAPGPTPEPVGVPTVDDAEEEELLRAEGMTCQKQVETTSAWEEGKGSEYNLRVDQGTGRVIPLYLKVDVVTETGTRGRACFKYRGVEWDDGDFSGTGAGEVGCGYWMSLYHGPSDSYAHLRVDLRDIVPSLIALAHERPEILHCEHNGWPNVLTLWTLTGPVETALQHLAPETEKEGPLAPTSEKGAPRTLCGRGVFSRESTPRERVTHQVLGGHPRMCPECLRIWRDWYRAKLGISLKVPETVKEE